MAFKMKDYGRTKELLDLLTEDRRVGLNEFYLGLLEKARKEVEANSTASPADAGADQPQKEVSAEEQGFLSKIEADPKDLDSKFAYAKYLFENARNEEAIEQALAIMKANKNWNEKAAYNLLIEIFTKLGNTSELVVASRKKLSKILF